MQSVTGDKLSAATAEPQLPPGDSLPGFISSNVWRGWHEVHELQNDDVFGRRLTLRGLVELARI
ncbi:MAG: hypothetical protein WDA77_06015 [Acidimicrobiia bacterium]